MVIKFRIALIFLILHIINAYNIKSRIAHGQNAVPKSASYIVSLQVETSPGKYRHSCGGSIINKNWIITAAHCLTDDDRVSRHIIKAGRYNITANESTEQQRKIDWYKNHENYDAEFGVAPNDIALIYVKGPFVWIDSVQPILLPKSGKQHTGIATLFGWGLLASQNGEFPDILQIGDIPIISNSECIEKLDISNDIILDPSNICTVSMDGISACSSDSGGPLIQNNLIIDKSYSELIGVVSWGPQCGRPNGDSVSVYVRVSSFIKWIKKVKQEYSASN